MDSLKEALGICRGDIVAFVGAGGKTSGLERLASELFQENWRVIATTTTKIRTCEGKSLGALVVAPDLSDILAATERGLRDKHLVTVATRHRRNEKKLEGIPASYVAPLARLADVVLVEADGARGRSLKAPAEHEPVIPPETTVMAAVAGLDAIGQMIHSSYVHRPELVAQLTETDSEALVTPQIMARVLADSRGGAKGKPPQARFFVLLNKADDPARLTQGRRVAWALARNPDIEATLLSTLQKKPPVREDWRRTAAIILAAGSASRYGAPKQMLPFGDTTTLGQILRTISAAPFYQIVLVLGANADQVQRSLPDFEAPVDVIRNPCWQEGLSTSMQAGLQALSQKVDAAMMVLADQPLLSTKLLKSLLIAQAQTDARIVAPEYQGQRRNPVLFHRSLFPALLAVSGDQGGRSVIAAHESELVTLPWDKAADFQDIDTPTDYAQVRRALNESRSKS
jgi:molybdenum cofactor cytidylyltransferase